MTNIIHHNVLLYLMKWRSYINEVTSILGAYIWIYSMALHRNELLGPLPDNYILIITAHRLNTVLILVMFINTLRTRQNGHHLPDDIFKCILLNENVWISIQISLNFVPKGPFSNITALVQIMAWHRPGDKPLSEPMMVSLLTHICITQPRWVKMPVQLCCN